MEELVYCPQYVREDMTSLRQLFGALQDERENLESIGRRRIEQLNEEIMENYEHEDEEDEEYMHMEEPLKHMHPFFAL